MANFLIGIGYVMGAIIVMCAITIVVVLASPVVLIGGAIIGAIWVLYAGLLLIERVV